MLRAVASVVWSWFWTIPKITQRRHTLMHINYYNKVNTNNFHYFLLFVSVSIAHDFFWMNSEWEIRRHDGDSKMYDENHLCWNFNYFHVCVFTACFFRCSFFQFWNIDYRAHLGICDKTKIPSYHHVLNSVGAN